MKTESVEMQDGKIEWDYKEGLVIIYGPDDIEWCVFSYHELDSLINGLIDAKNALQKHLGEGRRFTSEG